ncbi:MAG TPA: low temperature requirement protein A [Micromonosporaceae bacterium]|nr:low temperature requirement protein A [Micromonosporaceae bacterium]
MATDANTRRRRITETVEGAGVTPLELFFDLVFVYAFTQVTALMAAELNWHGVIRGGLVLALLWWCWCCFAWLGNTVRADEGEVRVVLFAVMATMFVIALTIPEAFEDLPGGLYAPVVFVACYVVVRVLHLSVYWRAAHHDPALRRQVLKASLPMLGGAALLLAAAGVHHRPYLQTALWAAAIAVDYTGIYLTGARGWRINSAAHWAERHGLIIIIALGESVVSIGIGVAALPISWPIIVASVLGIAVAAALWWAYFDVVAIAAERVLRQATGVRRAALARDSYTYLHLPMVGGIILLSLGLKKVLAYVGGAGHHDLTDPLTGVPLYALYGGVVLYLLGHLGFRLRNMGTVNRPRWVTMVLLLALIPMAAHVPALAALAILAAVCCALVVFEMIRYADARHTLRAAAHESG